MTVEFLVGTNRAIRALHDDIDLAARSGAPVLIAGEPGCGKRRIAKLIHDRSIGSHRSFRTITCAVNRELPDEWEPFTGTIFLDEIGELSQEKQAQVAKLLESISVCRCPDSGFVQADARVMAATRHRLFERVRNDEFRMDLYYRINVVYLHVPALRDRRGDILPLLAHFLDVLSTRHQRPVPALDSDAQAALAEYGWPENVRELMDVAEHLMLSCDTGCIRLHDLPRDITIDCRA